jgi:hypothetical protein
MRLKLSALCLVVLCLSPFTATEVAAQPLSVGIRGGASVDPDQFYFGGHVETRPLVERLHFRPNVEIGVGDDVTLVAFNFELVYKFAGRREWTPYVLGGPALNIVSGDDNTDAAGGFNFGLGIEHRQGLFGEIKVGVIDSPDFKIGIGYRF